MRAFEFITETGNRVMKYSWEKFLGSNRAIFKIGEHPYVFDAFDMKPGVYKIRFCQVQPNGDCSHEITGTGGAYETSATVTAILKDFINKVHPHTLLFSAEEESRRKMYDRILRREFPEWTVTKDAQFYTATLNQEVRNTHQS